MKEDVGDRDWMIDSIAHVNIEHKIVFIYSLHFWKSGKVDIFDTDRPNTIDVPEYDLRELKNWCTINNWKYLHVNDRLLVDPRGFEFWSRMYRCGLVQNDQLKQFDESEMIRLSKGGE